MDAGAEELSHLYYEVCRRDRKLKIYKWLASGIEPVFIGATRNVDADI